MCKLTLNDLNRIHLIHKSNNTIYDYKRRVTVKKNVFYILAAEVNLLPQSIDFSFFFKFKLTFC